MVSMPAPPASASAATPLDFEPVTDVGREAMAAILADPARTLLAVDFDGTLAPIIADPDQARADPDAVHALARLGGVLGNIAVVTGRPVATALRLGGFGGVAGLESMIILGQYGVERWDAATGETVEPPPPSGIVGFEAALPATLDAAGLGGVRMEHKGRAVVIHTRGLADAAGAFERLRDPLSGLAAEHGLVAEPGKLVWEVRGNGTDKGDAMRGLVEETGARQVIFAGDDLGDLPAYDVVDELRTGSLCGLLVCSASTEQDALANRADLVLDGTGDVAAWLSWLAAQLGA